jgi:ferric-dicitrate binding protein FerR (iron transport regulator)
LSPPCSLASATLVSPALKISADEHIDVLNRGCEYCDPKIANTKISGQFSSTNPDSLLKGLGALNAFNIRETAGRIEISAK